MLGFGAKYHGLGYNSSSLYRDILRNSRQKQFNRNHSFSMMDLLSREVAVA